MNQGCFISGPTTRVFAYAAQQQALFQNTRSIIQTSGSLAVPPCARPKATNPFIGSATQGNLSSSKGSESGNAGRGRSRKELHRQPGSTWDMSRLPGTTGRKSGTRRSNHAQPFGQGTMSQRLNIERETNGLIGAGRRWQVAGRFCLPNGMSTFGTRTLKPDPSSLLLFPCIAHNQWFG
ncbi:hypothetical protein LY76DRAFT_306143 [Colletotrichum caudatum]|nr:hypothetical protein LY76DRAFT_306143 [Colletotrichum caudatum]